VIKYDKFYKESKGGWPVQQKNLAANSFSNKIEIITDSLGQYLQGKDASLRLSLISFFSRGHLLIEDLPGLGKTTLAIGIAKALGLSFGRIQCTSDLLPTDITGLSIYNKTAGEFDSVEDFLSAPDLQDLLFCLMRSTGQRPKRRAPS
jgi:MoxR-like ATPase